jgi:hypothetical protein
MRTVTRKEWEQLYRSRWRVPYSDLTKEERGRLVQGCRGRVVFDSVGEAHEILRLMQSGGTQNLAAYTCPLCHGIHVVSRRKISQDRRLFGINHSPRMADARDHYEAKSRSLKKVLRLVVSNIP